MGKKNKKKKLNIALKSADYGPEELLQHHVMPKSFEPDPDRPGQVVLHRRNRTQTILDLYQNRGFITERQWKSGDRLRSKMRIAGLDAYVTTDLLKVGGGSPSFMIPTSEAMAIARQDVRKTFIMLGKVVSNVLMALIHDEVDVLESNLPCSGNQVQRRAALAGKVTLALDALADLYGEPYDR